MSKFIALVMLLLGFSTSAYAIPVLQVGAPAGPGDTGNYADYQKSLTNPTENDTAVTSGNLIYVAGGYANGVANLGGHYDNGKNWSDFGMPISFDAQRAILVASVPNGATGTLTVNNKSEFFKSTAISYFPNNHDPVKDDIADFYFFDIGTFANNSNAVPNFDDETQLGKMNGEIKNLELVITGFNWVHFDVMALETSIDTKKTCVVFTDPTDLENNPGSLDVTWTPSTPTVPEPTTVVLFGVGLIGFAAWSRKRRIV